MQSQGVNSDRFVGYECSHFLECVVPCVSCSVGIACVQRQLRDILFCEMCSGDSMLFPFGAYRYLRTTCLIDGPSPMCTVRSTLYSPSFEFGLFKLAHLLDGDVGTSKAKLACGSVRVFTSATKYLMLA